MNRNQQRQFVQELLNQMPALNSDKYKLYRKELDEKLARARNEEKSMRRIVVAAWVGAVLLFTAAGIKGYHAGTPPAQYPEWLVLSLITVVLLVPPVALVLLAFYLFKYRRRVHRAETDAQQAALGELQRQLNELRAQLPPGAANQPPTAPEK